MTRLKQTIKHLNANHFTFVGALGIIFILLIIYYAPEFESAGDIVLISFPPSGALLAIIIYSITYYIKKTK